MVFGYHLQFLIFILRFRLGMIALLEAFFKLDIDFVAQGLQASGTGHVQLARKGSGHLHHSAAGRLGLKIGL
ncbi:hypothetical protein D1872_288430 [compost metagenome]